MRLSTAKNHDSATPTPRRGRRIPSSHLHPALSLISERALCPAISRWQFNWIGLIEHLWVAKGKISPAVQIQKEAKQLPGPWVNRPVRRFSPRSPNASKRQWSPSLTGGGMSQTTFGTKPAVSVCNQPKGKTTWWALVGRHASSYLIFIYGLGFSRVCQGPLQHM